MTSHFTSTVVTLAEAAEALAVSTRTARRYIADGHLEAVRLGRRTIRVKVASIERFMNAVPVGNQHHAREDHRSTATTH